MRFSFLFHEHPKNWIRTLQSVLGFLLSTVLGGEKKIRVFAEAFNLFDRANFGSQFQGNGRSATFGQPTGFVPGIGYPRQHQLGARFLF